MNQSRCNRCNRVIEWIEVLVDGQDGPERRRIPIDPRAPTFEYVERQGEHGIEGYYRRSSAKVSHFSTCPQANDISTKREELSREELLSRRPYKED